MSVVTLSARTLARYAVPIAVLSAIAFAPLLIVGFGVRAPANAVQARIVVRTAYALAGASVLSLLVLVAGVAPAVRAVAVGATRSQLEALVAGVVGLVRGLVPALLAGTIVALGGVALVVPGAILLVLVSLSGASTAVGARARIEDSVARVRPQIARVAIVVAGVYGAYVVAIALSQRGLVPIPKKPSPEQLVAYRQLARAIVLAAPIIGAITAVALASMHALAPDHARRSAP